MSPVDFNRSVWGDLPTVYTQILRERRGWTPDLDRTALVVVDMNHGCVDPEGIIASTGADISAARAILPNVKKLIEGARKLEVDVAFTTGGRSAIPPEVIRDLINYVAPRVKSAESGGGIRNGEGFLKALEEGCKGEVPLSSTIVSELEPTTVDVVLSKYSEDAFTSDEVNNFLTRDKYDYLVFCGTATDMCLMSSARSAVERGFKCALVSDASATFDPEMQRSAETMFNAIYGEVWTTEEAIEFLERSRESALTTDPAEMTRI